MRKPGIPTTPKLNDDRSRFDGAIKESLETIMGRKEGKIKQLDPLTATLAETIAKVNEILDTMQ